MIAEVIPIARLPKNLSHFDYEVPQNFEGKIKIGQMVKIPLRGKGVNGIVTRLKNEPTEMKISLKQIFDISDLKINLDDKHTELLQWFALYYLVSPALILKTFFPEPPLRTGNFKIRSNALPASFSVPKGDLEEIRKTVSEIIYSKNSRALLYYNNFKKKTAILLKISEKIISEGKNVLILEPQVSDIEKITPYFLNLFQGKIAVLHGELSKTEYWKEWQKTKEGKAKIVFGTRSAIFAPLSKMGLIIIDDEESPDFKQSDQNPRYDVRDAALKLSDLTNAKVILTSQAPRPETYFLFKNYPDSQFFPKEISQPPIVLVDMNNEIKNKNFSSLAEKTKENINAVINQGKKIVLLLNRRGLSTMVLCRDCDYIFRCKNCKTPLACHDDECNLPSQFVCHNCGAKESLHLVCPKCRGTAIKYIGTGTQTVERDLKKHFPMTKILRVDKDAQILKIKQQISDSEIFVGTQFFIRNFLPKLQNIGLIGIISADTLIYRPDFRSGEKIFSWITGLINFGRQIKNPVIIQTFFPNNFFIQSSVSGNYELFYRQELEERKSLGYPPFGKLIKLTYSHINDKKCVFETDVLHKKLRTEIGDRAEISSSENPRKEKNKYSSTIVLKFPASSAIKIKNILVKIVTDEWTIDIDPESLI